MSSDTWPNGSHAAVLLNIMYEQWSHSAWPKIGPMGNPLPQGATDYQARSWAAYGTRTGIWDVLNTLESASVLATFYISGQLTETEPASVTAIAGQGHEIAAHAWSQDAAPALMSREAEGAEIKRCARAITGLVGKPPKGWMSPRCTPSDSTPELLAAAGFTWTGDVFDAATPYNITTQSGTITAFPFSLEINDLPLTVRYGLPLTELYTRFAHLASFYEDRSLKGYIDVTIHTHIAARHAGLVVLDRIIAEARKRGIWIATRSEALTALATGH